MVLTRTIPCLLVDEHQLVKTVRFKKPKYVGDPVNAIKIYNDKEVDELILLDITATQQNRGPNYDLIKSVADECFMPVCYGGGIHSIDQIKQIFSLGIEKISVNSALSDHPELIAEAAGIFGSQSIVASLDIRRSILGKYSTYTHRGKKRINNNVVDFAIAVGERGAGEILLNSIDREGTWDGFDLDLIARVTENVRTPVIAVGGAGNLQDISDAVNGAGASAVALGSMAVFQGKDLGVLINFPAAHKLRNLYGSN